VIVGSFDRSFLCDMFSPGRMLISITCSRCELATIENMFSSILCRFLGIAHHYLSTVRMGYTQVLLCCESTHSRKLCLVS
jgi:hypothetical protein